MEENVRCTNVCFKLAVFRRHQHGKKVYPFPSRLSNKAVMLEQRPIPIHIDEFPGNKRTLSNSSGRTACLLCQLQKNGPNAKTWNFESLEVELLQVSIWSLNCFEQIWVLPSRILGMLKWFLGDVQPANIKSNLKFKIHFSTIKRVVWYRHYKGN